MTPENFEAFNDENSTQSAKVVAEFTGTTGTSIQCDLDESLVGPYKFAAIIGSFELDGKTISELIEAMQKQGVLLGLSKEGDNHISYELKNGITIGPFEFIGL